MMAFLRRIILGNEIPSPDAIARREKSVQLLQQERGEFRQSLQRLSSGSRLMASWEEVGQMMKDTADDE